MSNKSENISAPHIQESSEVFNNLTETNDSDKAVDTSSCNNIENNSNTQLFHLKSIFCKALWILEI